MANQTLFTMRRVLYSATLGLTALAAAAGVVGLKFDATMEVAQVSFEHFLGGEQAATAELDYLFDLAAKTPFEFQPLMESARQFLAFGMSVQDTNRTLAATADAVATLGLTQDHVQRVIYAFSQMRAAGRVTGEELRQLWNAGIPASRYLQEQLGLSGDQLNNIADQRIPAERGILAIVRGMEQEFKGGSERIANTVQGQVTTMTDYVRQLLGLMMIAPFEKIRSEMPKLLTTLRMMASTMRDQGFMAMVEVLDEATGASGKLVIATKVLNNYMAASYRAVSTLFEVFKPFLVILGATALALLLVVTAIQDFIHWGGTPMVWILRVLVGWWITEIIVTKLATLASKEHIFWTKVQLFWIRRLIVFLRIGRVAFLLYAAAELQATRVAILFGAATIAAGGWIILAAAAVILLGAALVYLYFKYEKLRTAIIAVTLIIMPMLGVLLLLHHNWDRVSNVISVVWSKLRGFVSWIAAHKDVFLNMIPGVGLARGLASTIGHIPGLAAGGDIISPGVFQLHKDEILSLPVGAAVRPVDRVMPEFAGLGAGGPFNITIHPAPVNIDGRKVTEVVFSHRLDRIARR